MYNAKLQWHPQYSQYHLNNGDALFLSEMDQYLIAHEEYAQINFVIQNNGRQSDFIFYGDDIVNQVQRMQKIDDLTEKNILLENQPSDKNLYRSPDFNENIDIFTIDGNEIYRLTKFISSLEELDFYKKIGTEKSISIVLVDDLLDPRLSELNNRFIKENKSWLLVKPTGQQPSIGPIFSPGRKNSPCYDCLRFRLIQNNPVREWLKRKNTTKDFLPLLTLTCPLKINDAFKNFQKFYHAYFSDMHDTKQLLYIFENKNEAGSAHTIQHRPQCPTCGDPHLIARLQLAPIQLKDCFHDNHSDGGYRVNHPAVTLAKLTQLVSPITGVLTEFKDIIPTAAQEQLSIYQAAYFQNSYTTTIPTSDTFVQLSLGKGISKTQAMVSALGEAIERQAAQYSNEETTLFSSKDNLNDRAIIPSLLTPFSDAQYQFFSMHKGPTLLQPQWIAQYEHNTPIHWVQGWSLTHDKPVYFPAAYCLANTPFEDHIYSLYTHNGNAAGTTQEEAIFQGLLELIERDAVAIWWYNQIPRPEISLDIIPNTFLKIIAATLDAEWNYYLLDLTHDIEVTTCVAVGQHKLSGQFTMGFGCHLNTAIAAQRALTEMYQLITIKDKVTGPFDFNQIAAHPFLKPKRKSHKKNTNDFKTHTEKNIKNSILFIMELLKRLDMELCVVNYSRPDLPLQTVKVIVPGLCHFWPQLANERLYNVPVTLGWLTQPLQEHELNPQGLYL